MAEAAKKKAADLVGKPATTQATAPARSGQTCTMLCKLPNGITLRIHDTTMITVPSGVPGQVRDEPRKVEKARFTLNGNAFNHERAAEGKPQPLTMGGYAVTTGVPLDFARQWMSEHRDDEIVKNKIVMMAESESQAKDLAGENAAVKSGLQPMLKDNDPRARGMRPFREKDPVA